MLVLRQRLSRHLRGGEADDEEYSKLTQDVWVVLLADGRYRMVSTKANPAAVVERLGMGKLGELAFRYERRRGTRRG
jgi:hypothetical protein